MALPIASLSAHWRHCPPTCYRVGLRQERVGQECSRLIARGLPPSSFTPLIHWLLPLLAGEEGLGSDGLVGSSENTAGC